MRFRSVLFGGAGHVVREEQREAPACFPDLHLDQVVEAITTGREAYDLEPFFFAPLENVASVEYRHEVFRDLDSTPLLDHVRSFSRRMRTMLDHLAQGAKLRHRYQKRRWFLDAVAIYCDAVRALANDLAADDCNSRAFLALREYLTQYTESDAFLSLATDTSDVRRALDEVSYCVHIRGNRVHVSKYDQQTDYSVEVEETFEKFRQGAVEDYRTDFVDRPEMNHVESQILDLVAQLYSDTFASLDLFCDRHRDYLDPTIARFDREVQFYVGYLEYTEMFKPAGLRFCYPRVSEESKEVSATQAFDIALANRLVGEHARVVSNDFFLRDPERIFVVTGPNQGGKTTFARMVGQLHYLASIGCPVPGAEATLFLVDQLLTHFEKEEDLANLSGKLEDDLLRVHAILEAATADSLVILNEIFTSTTLQDALFLSTKVMEEIISRDLLCVWVTFVDELASLGDSTTSMVSTVEPDNPAVRTYKVVRRPADGLSYAFALAEKYGVTFEQLKERIAS